MFRLGAASAACLLVALAGNLPPSLAVVTPPCFSILTKGLAAEGLTAELYALRGHLPRFLQTGEFTQDVAITVLAMLLCVLESIALLNKHLRCCRVERRVRYAFDDHVQPSSRDAGSFPKDDGNPFSFVQHFALLRGRDFERGAANRETACPRNTFSTSRRRHKQQQQRSALTGRNGNWKMSRLRYPLGENASLLRAGNWCNASKFSRIRARKCEYAPGNVRVEAVLGPIGREEECPAGLADKGQRSDHLPRREGD